MVREACVLTVCVVVIVCAYLWRLGSCAAVYVALSIVAFVLGSAVADLAGGLLAVCVWSWVVAVIVATT